MDKRLLKIFFFILGSGNLVKPADVIVRPGAGTGCWGSGSIRLQAATLQTPPSPNLLYSHYKYPGTSLSTLTDSFFVPTGLTSNRALIMVVTCDANLSSVATPISGAMLAGATPTFLFGSNNATTGFIRIYFRLNPPTGTQTYTLNFSTTQTAWMANVYLFESVGSVLTTTFSQADTATNSFSTTATVNEEDLVLTVMRGTYPTSSWPSSSAWPITSLNRQTNVFVNQNNQSQTFYTQLSSITTVPTATTSIQVGYNFGTNITGGLVVAMILKRSQPTSSDAPTYTDALVVGPYARTAPPEPPLPLVRFIELSTSANLIYLTASDPRVIIFTNASAYSNVSDTENKVVLLPRADHLSLNTDYYFYMDLSGTNRNQDPRRIVRIAPRSTVLTTYSATSSFTVFDSVAQLQQTNRFVVVTLKNNITSVGTWTSENVWPSFIIKQFVMNGVS